MAGFRVQLGKAFYACFPTSGWDSSLYLNLLFGKIQRMLVLSFRREAQTLAIGIHPTSNYTIVISVFYSPR